MALVGTGWMFSHLDSTNRCRNHSSLCRDTISDAVGSFQSNGAFASKKALAIGSLLKSVCGHESQHSKKLWLKFLVLAGGQKVKMQMFLFNATTQIFGELIYYHSEPLI